MTLIIWQKQTNNGPKVYTSAQMKQHLYLQEALLRYY